MVYFFQRREKTLRSKKQKSVALVTHSKNVAWGCGYTEFRVRTGRYGRITNDLQYTCLFSPGPGHYKEAKELFTIGNPCSLCPKKKCSTYYPGLCLRPPDYTNSKMFNYF